MIDELWDGLTVVRQSPNGDHALAHIDVIGNITSETYLSEECMPAYLAHAPQGWVASAGGTILPPMQVVEIDESGMCSVLADFSEDEDNPVVVLCISPRRVLSGFSHGGIDPD